MKHAYLIIAHNEPELFGILISLLDDERNDIYVMIDERVDIAPFKKYSTRRSKLIFVEPRIQNYWGMFAQVETELKLFEKAYSSGRNYDYYHLLSGVDLPLKTPAEIDAFLSEQERMNDGQPIEYLGFTHNPARLGNTRRRVYQYHLLMPYMRSSNLLVSKSVRAIRKVLKGVQEICRISRPLPKVKLKKGHNWATLSKVGVGYLLLQRPFIKKMFFHSECPDELYKQTVLFHSPLRRNIYEQIKAGLNENESALREIDWERAEPYVWTIADIDELQSSKMFFARKFTLKTPEGRAVVEALVKLLQGRNHEKR